MRKNKQENKHRGLWNTSGKKMKDMGLSTNGKKESGTGKGKRKKGKVKS